MSVSVFVEGESTLQDLNVTNANWAAICRLVGAEDVYCGCIDGVALAVFREKVAFALGSVLEMPALDAGKPTEVLAPNVIDCGRRDGYFADRLTALLEIVDDAIARQKRLCWG